MRRLACLMALTLGAMITWGCGSGKPTLPANPTVDNRDEETKSADDYMLKQVQAAKSAKTKKH